MSDRFQGLHAWLEAQFGGSDFQLRPASGDASFRRYFRVCEGDRSFIVMDAPPGNEDCRPFVDLAARFAAVGLHVPEIHATDLAQGFLLLEDLGTTHYLDVLDDGTASRLYGDALGALAVIQACGPQEGLPEYDRALLMREMELFSSWLVEGFLAVDLAASHRQTLSTTFALLAENALCQPRVCVHRDFHSRNLLVCDPPTPGILDFQDAVLGPVTYDLVSLLRDCYVSWPEQRIDDWLTGYFELAVQSGIIERRHEDQFPRWFDLMGIQRHLKAAGIFARLDLRDGKPGYLQDIPRTLGYVAQVAPKYPELQWLSGWISESVLPAVRRRLG